MFSVAEFSELSPLQKFSLCIFALLLQDLELKLSQNWFCDVTTLWSTAARIKLSCTVLYMIVWFLSSYWNKINQFPHRNTWMVKSCSKTANLPSSVSVDGCVVPGFNPLVRWTSCRTTKRWIQTDSKLAFGASPWSPWNLAFYKQNQNNYRLYTNPYCTDFIAEGTWENVSRHQLSTEVPWVPLS